MSNRGNLEVLIETLFLAKLNKKVNEKMQKKLDMFQLDCCAFKQETRIKIENTFL